VVDSSVDLVGPALVRDAADKIHILYQDAGYFGTLPQAGDVKHATNASGVWGTEVVDNVGSTVYSSAGLAVGPDGSLHAGYYAAPGFKLRHAVSSGPSWSLETAQTPLLNCHTTAIAVDSAGKVHVVCNATSQIVYVTNASGSWTQESIDTMGVIGYFPIAAIAVGPAGVVHVAYLDDTNFDLKHAVRTGGVWQLESVDAAGDVGLTPSIALGPSGAVHICYQDITNQALKHATNASGSWILETVDSSGNVGVCSSAAVDASGALHVSYRDDSIGGLRYATNSSGSWVAIVLDSPNVETETSLALDGSGYVHIGYGGRRALKWITNHP